MTNTFNYSERCIIWKIKSRGEGEWGVEEGADVVSIGHRKISSIIFINWFKIIEDIPLPDILLDGLKKVSETISLMISVTGHIISIDIHGVPTMH